MQEVLTGRELAVAGNRIPNSTRFGRLPIPAPGGGKAQASTVGAIYGQQFRRGTYVRTKRHGALL